MGAMGASSLCTLLPCPSGCAGLSQQQGTGDLIQPQLGPGLELAFAALWPHAGPLLDCPLGAEPIAPHPNTPRGTSGRGLPELCWWEDGEQ